MPRFMGKMLFLAGAEVNFAALRECGRVDIGWPGRVAMHPHVVEAVTGQRFDARLEPVGQTRPVGGGPTLGSAFLHLHRLRGPATAARQAQRLGPLGRLPRPLVPVYRGGKRAETGVGARILRHAPAILGGRARPRRARGAARAVNEFDHRIRSRVRGGMMNPIAGPHNREPETIDPFSKGFSARQRGAGEEIRTTRAALLGGAPQRLEGSTTDG